MSPDLARRNSVADDVVLIERRSHKRYPIELDLRYKLFNRARVMQEGLGRTCDLSTGGVLFRLDQSLPKGSRAELSVDWPLRLDGVCPLQVLISGQVVRSWAKAAVVRITHYEFRTRGNQFANEGNGRS